MDEELKETASVVVGQALKAASDDPKLKQAGKHLAGAALTAAKAVENALFPLAAINYGFDKARAYFEKRFRDEFAEHVDSIPTEHVVLPRPSVAGPALQGLAFTHDEPDLKNMYLCLLAASMDGRRATSVHPAFVEVIRQLTAEEARLLPSVLNYPGARAIAEIRISNVGEAGYRVVQQHVIDLKDPISAESIGGLHAAAMVDNWLRLSLVVVNYSKQVMAQGAYDWVKNRPEFLPYANVGPHFHTSIGKGFLERTAFGMKFASAAGLDKPFSTLKASTPPQNT